VDECWIIQGSTRLSPVHHMMNWILVLWKKEMPKKKVIAERNLEHWTKFTTQINDKKQIQVF
jgi:hypothetical protein